MDDSLKRLQDIFDKGYHIAATDINYIYNKLLI